MIRSCRIQHAQHAYTDIAEYRRPHPGYTDGTEQQIVMPYAVAVNPTTRELYITDAGDFIAPGKVYCFTPEGQLQWKATTGNTPSRIAFTSIPHIFSK